MSSLLNRNNSLRVNTPSILLLVSYALWDNVVSQIDHCIDKVTENRIAESDINDLLHTIVVMLCRYGTDDAKFLFDHLIMRIPNSCRDLSMILLCCSKAFNDVRGVEQ